LLLSYVEAWRAIKNELFFSLDVRGAKVFTSYPCPTFLKFFQSFSYVRLTDDKMPRPEQDEKNESRQVLDYLGEGSALPRSRHFAAAFAGILIIIILIYLKLFNHS
jgi:hypothetical protein